MNILKEIFSKNVWTTIFGIMAGLPGAVVASGVVAAPWLSRDLVIVSSIGLVGLGVMAKDFNSTPDFPVNSEKK